MTDRAADLPGSADVSRWADASRWADVSGRVADGFEGVRDAFAETLADTAGGGAVALVVDGVTVVDLWGGRADGGGPPDRWSAGPLPVPHRPDPPRPWERSTRAVVFSVSKALLTLCVLRAAADGHLDLDAPAARGWPEFGAAGKDAATGRDLLAHRAGLPVLAADLTRAQVLAWDPAVAALAAQHPDWEPGSAWAYHAITLGWLGGELLRRATGQLPGAVLAERFAGPLGLSTAIGIPPGEAAAVATVVAAPPAPLPPDGPARDRVERDRAALQPGGLVFPGLSEPHAWNDPDVLAAQLPAANGVSSALDLAVLFAAVVGSDARPGLLPAGVLAEAVRPRSGGTPAGGDPADPGQVRGTGFQLPCPGWPVLSAGSFGHGGAGGQLVLGDTRHRAGFAYLTNRMGGADDDRAARLVAAARTALG